jgi:pilus assembly protein Flp/PilA
MSRAHDLPLSADADAIDAAAFITSRRLSMKHLWNGLARFLRDEEGANGVEYALLAGLIAVAFIIGAGLLGTNLNTFFNALAGCIQDPLNNCNPLGGA